MKMIKVEIGKKPTIVEIDSQKMDYKKIKELMGNVTISCIERKIGSKWYSIYVDDNGLLSYDDRYMTAICDNATEVLVGNILITKHNDNGDMKSLSKKDIEEIMNESNWLVTGDDELYKKYGEYGDVYVKPYSYILTYKI